jgi:CRISPR-associated endonuclease/helicase Cas3
MVNRKNGEDTGMGIGNYLAKQHRTTRTRHLLLWHSLDVAAIFDAGCEANPRFLKKLAGDLGVSESSARSLMLFLLSVHDIGKNGSYQSCDVFRHADGTNGLGLNLSRYDKYARDHADLGYVILMRLLRSHLKDRKYGAPFPERPLQTNDRTDLIDRFRTLFAMTAGHHGTQPSDHLTWANFSSGRCTEADLTTAGEMVNIFSNLFSWDSPVPDRGAINRMSYVLNGLITLCDWLGSNSAFTYYDSMGNVADALGLPAGSTPETICEAYYKDIALPTARRVVNEYRPAKLWPFLRPSPVKIEDILARVASDGEVLSPSPMQKACDEAFRSDVPEGPLIVIIRDETGSGKTEALGLIEGRLSARGDACGAFRGLPTMATADSAFARMKKVVDLFAGEKPSMTLSHGRRHLNPAYKTASSREKVADENSDAHAFFASSSKTALHADYGAGSTDTALGAGLRSKHSTMKLAGLWGKVLSIDEVHAYDEYMIKILEGLLYHQASVGSPVVLLSATLPERTVSRLLNAYSDGAGWNREPFPPATPSQQVKSRAWLTIRSASRYCNIPVAGGSPQAMMPVRYVPVSDINIIFDRLIGWAKQGKCAIWYRNTVTEAVESWSFLKSLAEKEGLPEPILFHSRFVYADRREAEKTLLRLFGRESGPEDRRSRLVVSTQAAEQSLDLDFDEQATDAAPLEAMEQRRGRRRRHPRTASGTLLRRSGGIEVVDQRPESEILLYMEPLEKAKAGWYSKKSSAAHHIYKDHALIWLACQFLTNPNSIPGRWDEAREQKEFIPAYDIGPALEACYPADDTGPAFRKMVPAPLWGSHLAERGESLEKKYRAEVSSFTFKPGLLHDWNLGQEMLSSGDTVPTRLGFGWTYVVLEKTASGLRFLRDGEDPIELSSLRLPMHLTLQAGDAEATDRWKKSLPEKLARKMAFYSAIVLSRSDKNKPENDSFFGECIKKITDKEKKIVSVDVSVSYSKKMGLIVKKI